MRWIPVVLVLVVVTACSGDDGGEARGTTTTTAPSTTAGADPAAADASVGGWLFVVDAESGTTDGTRLALAGVDEDVVAFSDRPARRAERLTTTSLVDDWATLGFDDDPPNAAVTVRGDDGDQTAVVTLRDPSLEPDGSTLRFAIDPVDLDDSGLLGRSSEPLDALPALFGRTTLFIDPGTTEGQPAEGTISVSGVTNDDYDAQKQAAEAVSRRPCVTTDQLEICQVIEPVGDGISWSVAAALLEGDDDAQSAFELKAILPGGGVQAEAISPPEDTGSKWVLVSWESPDIEVPGAGLTLEAVVQIGDSDAVVSTCVVEGPPDPPDAYCTLGAGDD